MKKLLDRRNARSDTATDDTDVAAVQDIFSHVWAAHAKPHNLADACAGEYAKLCAPPAAPATTKKTKRKRAGAAPAASDSDGGDSQVDSTD